MGTGTARSAGPVPFPFPVAIARADATSARLVPLEDALRAEPVLAALGPGGARVVARTQAVAVAARGVEVHLGRHAGALQGEVEVDAVLGVDPVVGRLRDEHLRRLRRHADLGR